MIYVCYYYINPNFHAQALEIIPYTLAEDAGINTIQLVTELRNRHTQGEHATGINVKRGVISDMWAEHVVQPLLVNTSEIALSTECVGMILKIGTIQSRYALYLTSAIIVLTNPMLFLKLFIICR